MESEPFIDIRNLAKVYPTRKGGVLALDGVSLQVRHGEFLAIVGPSGCGKTTLLNMVAGLVPCTSGEVFMEGRRVEGPQTNIGIAFQTPVLLDWRSVLENVLLQIEMRELPRDAYEAGARRLLSQVKLDGFEDRYPYELSGGMQQRVALCRALIHDPPVLLMDEPFGALDTLTREQMCHDLQRIWMASRKTVLFITHSIQEAVFLADRVLGMTPRPGRIDLLEEIRLPRPRTMEMLDSPAFTQYTRMFRAMFRAQGILTED